MVRQLRLHLPVQGMWVRSLVTELRSHQPPATTEPMSSRARAPKEEKPPQQETHALQLEKSRAPQQRPRIAGIFFFLIKRKKESYRCLQVWCLVLAVDSFLILEVLTGLLLSPFFPSPSLFQSLSLCVASYLSGKTYLL